MDFRVKTIGDEKELEMLKDFMLRQPQFYPNFRGWVDGVCIPGVERGEREAILVLSEGILVGDGVYKFLEKGGIEIKNFRIDSDYRNRDLGHFLLTQIQRQLGRQGGKVILDATTKNFPAVEFYTRNGFHIKGMEQLYQEGQEEYLFEKTIPAQAA